MGSKKKPTGRTTTRQKRTPLSSDNPVIPLPSFLLENVAAGVLRITVTGVIEDANPEASALLGSDRSDLKGKLITDVFPVLLGHDLATDGTYTASVPRTNARPVETTISVRHFLEGDRDSIFLFVQRSDRSDERDEHQEAILKSIPLILYSALTPSQVDAAWMSESALRITGFPPSVFTTKPNFWSERIHPDDVDRVNAAFRGIRQGATMEVIYRWQCANGAYRWFLDRAISLHKTPDGTVSYSGIWLDITELRETSEALRTSEDRYRTLVNTLPDALTVVDMAGNLTFVSPQTLRFYGYEHDDEVLGRNLLEWVAEQDHPRAKEALAIVAAGRNIEHKEYLLKRRDGSTFIGAISASGFQDASGKRIGAVILVRDVSEQKALEEALRTTQFCVDKAAIGILRTDNNGKILGANEKLCANLGYTQDELCSLHVWELDPDFPRDVWQEHRKSLKKSGTTTFETRHRRKDGSLFPVQVTTNYMEYGGVGFSFAFVTDITDRVKRDQQYRLLAETVKSIEDCVSITDMENRFIFVNDSFERTYGYSLGELVGEDSSILKGKGIAKNVGEEIFAATLAGGWYGEIPNRRKDGSEFPVQLWTSVVKDGKGNPVALVGVARDATHHHEAEKALKESEARYRSIIDLAPIGIYQSTVAGKFITANVKLAEMLGFSSVEELMQLDIRNDIYLNSEDRDMLVEQFRHSTSPAKVDVRWKHKSGSTLWVELNLHAIRDNKGHLERFEGFAQDVTQRKKMTEDLMVEEERLRMAMLSSHQGWYDLNIQTGQVIVSPEYRAMLGYEEQEFQPTLDTWMNGIHPDDREETMRLFKECLTSGKVYIADYRRKVKSGQWKWIHSSGKVVEYDAEGKPVRMIGTHADISDQKIAEQALLESRRLLLESQRVAKLGHFVLDIASGRWEGSDALFTLMGIDASFDRTIDGWLRVVHPDHREAVRHHLLNEVIARRTPLNHEYRIMTIDTTESRWVHGIGEVECDKEGTVVRVMGTIQDITERKQSEELIQQNVSLLQATLESTADGILVVSNNGKISGYNRKFQTMWRIPDDIATANEDDSLIAFVISQMLYPGQFIEKVRQLYDQPFAEAHDILEFKDGRIFDRYSTPQHIGAIPVGRVWSFRDITEQRRAEEALRQSEEQNRAILNAVPDILFRIRRDGTIVDYRAPEIGDLYVGPDQFLGRKVADVLPPHVAEPAMNAIARTLATGKMVSFEYALDVKNEVQYYEDRVVALSSEEALSVVRNVTQRRRAEQAVRDSEERFRITLYSIGDGVITTDTAGLVRQMNRVAETLTGWTEEEAQGKPVMEIFRIVDEDSGTALADPVSRALQEGTVIGLSSRTMLIARDGTKRSIADSSAPIRNRNGEIGGVVLVFNDQSERRELQSQLTQAQKLEAVGRLAGGVAHDFNNMVGVILGYAKLMEHDLSPMDPLARHVQAITSAAERSMNLTRQLLAFARKQVISPVPLNLNEALSGLHRMLVRLIGEDITLHLHLSPTLWNTKIDPTQVDQLLANLATNSRDAIGNVGTIVIATENITVDSAEAREHPDVVPGEYVMISFSDSGSGMDAETRARIFEPFFTTKPKGVGTGLGLATVFGIVKQNNGFIRVESEPGKGTTFRVCIPRFLGPVSTPQPRQEDRASRGKETILVVEDEEQLLDLAKIALEMQGYKVLAAKSPGDALVLCERSGEQIDLLLTDVIMPGMNGKELRTRLTTIKPGLKTLFMSGYTADIVAMRGVLEDGVHFLQKPFTPAQLANRVRETLDKESRREDDRSDPSKPSPS
jgi:PAS domain S-box-containing protein